MAMHINPAHRGKFTAKHLTVEEGLHSKSATTRKEANFARMAKRHFKPLKKKRTDSDRAHRMYGGRKTVRGK